MIDFLLKNLFSFCVFPVTVFGRSEGKRGKILIFGKRKRSVQYAKYLFKALARKGFSVLWIYVKDEWLSGVRGVFSRALYKRILKKFSPDVVLFRSFPSKRFLVSSIDPSKSLRVIFYPVPTVIKNLRDGSSKAEIARMFDYFFVNWKDSGELRELGINSHFLMQGVDPEEHFPFDGYIPEFASDVSFVGKPYFEERIEFIKRVWESFDLKLYGGNWEAYGMKEIRRKVGPKEFSMISASSKVSLGHNIEPWRDHYFSNRIWLVLGCRGFCVTNYVSGMEDIFENHRHLVWFSDWDEFVSVLDFYLKNDASREKVVHEGYRFVIKNRTYDHVVDDMLKTMGF